MLQLLLVDAGYIPPTDDLLSVPDSPCSPTLEQGQLYTQLIKTKNEVVLIAIPCMNIFTAEISSVHTTLIS